MHVRDRLRSGPCTRACMTSACICLLSAGSITAAAAVASTYAGSDDGSEGPNNVTPSILRKTSTSYKPGDGANVPWRPPGPGIRVPATGRHDIERSRCLTSRNGGLDNIAVSQEQPLCL